MRKHLGALYSVRKRTTRVDSTGQVGQHMRDIALPTPSMEKAFRLLHPGSLEPEGRNGASDDLKIRAEAVETNVDEEETTEPGCSRLALASAGAHVTNHHGRNTDLTTPSKMVGCSGVRFELMYTAQRCTELHLQCFLQNYMYSAE